jgi:hypothetical protein
MKTYTTITQWFSRYDKENWPKEDCEVLLCQKTPLGYETIKGQFSANEYNSDGELINEASFFPIEKTHCMNLANNWNDDFEYWCYLPKLEEV